MLELTAEALVAAPREVVWADWTDPAALAAWIWPQRFQTIARIDLGETWTVRSETMGIAVVATVLRADGPNHLRLAWRWDGEEAVTDVDVVFEEAQDAATRVIVRHTGFATAEERASHIEGWTHCLDRLVDRHRGGEPG